MSLLPVVTATASSVNGAGFVAANAVDMVVSVNSGDRWASSTVTMPQWLQLDLGTSQVADYYVVAPGLFQTAQDPSAWTFEGSNDASSWTVLDTRSSWVFSGAPQRFNVSNSTTYRYYRIHITATNGNVASISEFRVGITEASIPAVAESAVATIDNASSGSVAITTVPSPGQTVLVSVACNRTDVIVTGLGAAWTQVCNTMASSFGGAIHSVWAGTGATSAGNISITAGGVFNAQVLALTLTNCDGTNIKALTNGATSPAMTGQLVLSAVYESASGSPVLGGSTVPAVGSWTQTSLFTAASGHKLKQAYIFGSAGGHGAQWTGLTGAAANTLVLGFSTAPSIAQVEAVYVEAMDTGIQNAQVEGVYLEALDTGVTSVQVEAAYLNVMTAVEPAQVETVYAETLLTTTPPAQIEAVYVEAMLLPIGNRFKGWGVPI